MGWLDRIRGAFAGRAKAVDINQRFELLREAVSGTMSNFYMARDRDSGQVVGLKIADRDKTEVFETRFRGLKKPAEGEIAMQFSHPLIVKTLEHGITTDGLRYIVMEYLDGPGLQQLIHGRSEKLVGKRVQLIRKMAEALAVVHAQGYIHRDICPRNYICNSDLSSLKLIDFGLTLPDSKDYRQPGNRTGTPLYMAPEVVRRRWTDHRVDIFSLGVTAYQLCCFELPWPVAETSGVAALAHDTAEPRDIRELQPEIDPTLASAITQCLAARPDKRPATIDALLRMIRAVPATF